MKNIPSFKPKRGKQTDSYGVKWFSKISEIKQRDKVCMVCGSAKGPFDTHHARSLGQGGSTTGANLMLLCKTCHDLRHVKTLSDLGRISSFKRKRRA